MSKSEPSEAEIREAFTEWVSIGGRKDWYPLLQLAGGDYYSPHTDHAWKCFREGYLARSQRSQRRR